MDTRLSTAVSTGFAGKTVSIQSFDTSAGGPGDRWAFTGVGRCYYQARKAVEGPYPANSTVWTGLGLSMSDDNPEPGKQYNLASEKGLYFDGFEDSDYYLIHGENPLVGLVKYEGSEYSYIPVEYVFFTNYRIDYEWDRDSAVGMVLRDEEEDEDMAVFNSQRYPEVSVALQDAIINRRED